MAEEEKLRRRKSSKRKRTKVVDIVEEEEEVSNLHNKRVGSCGDGIWDNLDLILSLDNKQLDLQRRVELALNFINSTKLNKKGLEEEVFCQNLQTVSLLRVITFLNGWIQSLLIPAENKKNTAEQEAYMDFRCWQVFRFCLEECLILGIQMNVSSNMLRSLSCIVRNVLNWEDLVFTDEDYEHYSIVCDCVVLLFSHHRAAMLNANFDLWVSLVIPVVDLVQKIATLKITGNNMGALLLRFSSLVLEAFDSFLKVHPSPKNIFPVFVDKLLEPLLTLLAELYFKNDRDNSILTRNLLKMVEDILSNGLFHPVHVDGFLTIHRVETYIESNNVKFKNSKAVVKSYHRHFFKKLEKIIYEKVSALDAAGRLFHLFTVRVKKQKEVSVLSYTMGIAETVSGFSQEFGTGSMRKFCARITNVVPESTHLASRLDAETSKSLFGLFLRFMDPLMLHLKHYSEATMEGQHDLVGSISILKSINKILVSFVEEKIYARAEDYSEGACLYLKDIFQIVISFSTKVHLLWSSSVKTDEPSNLFPLLAKELIDSLGHFLEIDYEVIETELVSLWKIMFIFSEIDQSLMETPDKGLLTSQILHLGSRLIKIYSELRQVNKPIFALCKAVRLFTFGDNHNDIAYSRFIEGKVNSSVEVCAEPVTMLFTSQDFRAVISNAIKLIPEGQVSVCIQELKIDISESLQWMKVTCSTSAESTAEPYFQSCSMSALHLQAELFGRVLAEIYTLILDYSPVTTSNSVLVRDAIKGLVTVVTPSLSKLVGKRPNSVSEFLVSVFGRNMFIKMAECMDDAPPLEPNSIGIFVFFFRVYMSCRILFRQSIKLMPPDSKETATLNLITAYCGKDWMDAFDWKDDAYFSWIIEPSDSLMNIIQSVCDSCLKDNTLACAPLTYVLHAMALQRLVDLNMKIQSFEYLHEKFARLSRKDFMDTAILRQYRKERKRYDKLISVLKQEAMDITSFLMTYLPVIVRKVQAIFADNNVDCERHEGQKLHKVWDMSICSLTEKLQPTAIWWILCQNTNVWCAHATKKNLKKFLSCLLQSSSSFVNSSNQIVGPDNLRTVTLPQVSLLLLSDTVFHEESFLCRYLTSRFCHVLEKSVLQLFNDSIIEDVDLNSKPKWDAILRELEEMPFVLSKVCVNSGPDILSSKFFSLEGRKQLAICQNLLGLLSWLPKIHMESKDFSVCATYILNLERLVVFSLLRCCGEMCMEKRTELLSLFLYSRKALKWLVMAYCDKQIEIGQSSPIPVLCDSSFSILWLLKSVSAVVQCMHGCSEENICEVKHKIFSLMDHTSYLFLTLSKIQCTTAVCLLQHEVTETEIPLSGKQSSEVTSMDPDTQVETTGTCDVWEVVLLMAETFKDQMRSLHVFLKTKLPVVNIEIWSSVFNRLSSLISGFQGFLWGLASIVNEIDLRSTKLFLCIHEFEDFINFCLSAIIVEEHPQSDTFCGNPSAPLPGFTEDSLSFDKLGSGEWIKTSSGQDQGIRSEKTYSSTFGTDSECENVKPSEIRGTRNSNPRKKKSQVIFAENAIKILNDANLSERQKLKIPLLQSLLSGEKPELAFLIREIFTASSAILRLKSKFGHCKYDSNSMAVFIWTSQYLLSEMVEMVVPPHPFSFVWLDGVLKYIEVLGSYISLIDTTLSNSAYAKLINIHLSAIGKCIALQGKLASLASHEYESNTKTLDVQTGPHKVSTGNVLFGLDEFKARLRMSFGVLIKKPQIWPALEAIERALVGMQENCSNYEINTGLLDVGKVSLIAAGAVDCFDLLLESVSGPKHVDAVKTYTERIFGALFNIVLHLQGPLIFYGNPSGGKGDNDPDPGSVILMCIEVLRKVAGKPYLFQMHSCHIGQSIHVPATLFQDFHMIRSSQTSIKLYSETSYPGAIAGSFSYVADHQFSVDLFAACCRLLCTVLRHRTSESERCMANLQSSVCALLHCLETVDTEFRGEIGNHALELHEGIKCASLFRRIYEEIRQQKEKIRPSFFLSNYILIYSGYGPSKRGIRREIDEALRPGVYSLMDACSPEDLQLLHTNLGEGPSRRTLADLQHDYKQNFQYKGKV